jgi:hypothetical protein
MCSASIHLRTSAMIIPVPSPHPSQYWPSSSSSGSSTIARFGSGPFAVSRPLCCQHPRRYLPQCLLSLFTAIAALGGVAVVMASSALHRSARRMLINGLQLRSLWGPLLKHKNVRRKTTRHGCHCRWGRLLEHEAVRANTGGGRQAAAGWPHPQS